MDNKTNQPASIIQTGVSQSIAKEDKDQRRAIAQFNRNKQRYLNSPVSTECIQQDTTMGSIRTNRSDHDLNKGKRIQDDSLKNQRNATEETNLALDEFAILLGAKRQHVNKNIKEYLKILKREVFNENGAVLDDIIRGIFKQF